MKTIQATNKPPFNEWALFIHKEVSKHFKNDIKNSPVPGNKTQIKNKI